MTSVAMPSVPSEPTKTPIRSGPGSSADSATTSPSGSTTTAASTWWTVNAVLQAVRAAGVLGHVAADRADLLARWIGRIEVAVGGHSLRHLKIRHAGLHDDPLGVEIDVEHAVHTCERDHDPLGDRQRAAG